MNFKLLSILALTSGLHLRGTRQGDGDASADVPADDAPAIKNVASSLLSSVPNGPRTRPCSDLVSYWWFSTPCALLDDEAVATAAEAAAPFEVSAAAAREEAYYPPSD